MRPGVAARLQAARLSREERTLVLLYLATWHAKVLADALDHVLGVRRRRDGARRVNKLDVRAKKPRQETEKAPAPRN